MGIILGALGGAGEAMEAMGARDQNAQAAQDLETMRAGLEADKEDRLHEYADQGVNNAQAYLTDAASQQVPVSAAPVTSLSGTAPGSTNGPGVTGAASDAPTGKSDDLAQSDPQVAADTKTNPGIVAGQMRNVTSAEASDAAYDAAVKAGDIKAANAIKALQTEKQTKVGKDEAVLDRNGRVIFQNTTGSDEAARREASLERRSETHAAAVITAQQIRSDASERNTQLRFDVLTSGLTRSQTSSWKDQFNTRMSEPGATVSTVLSDMGESKHKSDETLVLNTASSLQANGLRPPKGDTTNPQVYAVQQARLQLDAARGGQADPATTPARAAPAPTPGQMPVGGKLIGNTPAGKQVFQMPDGSRQVAQ